MDKAKQIQLIKGTHVVIDLQYANAEASLVKKKKKKGFSLDMNTDQSLLGFSIFILRQDSPNPSFLWHISETGRCRKMTAWSSNKSIVEKLLKRSVLMHLLAFCCYHCSVLQVAKHV